jgi:hypothetical protein
LFSVILSPFLKKTVTRVTVHDKKDALSGMPHAANDSWPMDRSRQVSWLKHYIPAAFSVSQWLPAGTGFYSDEFAQVFHLFPYSG